MSALPSKADIDRKDCRRCPAAPQKELMRPRALRRYWSRHLRVRRAYNAKTVTAV
jgi:hypothetical protein